MISFLLVKLAFGRNMYSLRSRKKKWKQTIETEEYEQVCNDINVVAGCNHMWGFTILVIHKSTSGLAENIVRTGVI